MPESLPDVIARAAERFADDAAIRTSAGTISYRELEAGTAALAARLAELGAGGERVGVLLPNVPHFPVLLYGLLRAGGRALLLNPLEAPRGFAEVLADAGARTVITTERLAALLPRDVRRVLVDELPTALRVVAPDGIRTVPLAGAGAAPEGGSGGDAEAVVVYTAAMDGWARGARLSHRNLIANLRSTVEAMRISPEDRVVTVLPLIHTFGLTVTMNAPLAAGASLIPVERFHPLRLLDLFEAERATVFCGVPAMFAALVAAAERRGTPQHALRVALSGGAPLPAEVAGRWEELFGTPLREGYGLTEAAPVCLFNRVDRPNRVGTLGFPFPNVEVTVRAETGTVLPPGEVGEICVRGPNVFLGYVGEEGRNPRDFHGDSLRTGDLGNEEPDGRIRFRGFLKPMFTRNGFNVYPRELERVLAADPRVAGVRVCALPDPERENEIVVFVRPAPGATLGEEEVRVLCAERLAAYKQPGRIYVEEDAHNA